MARRTLAIDAEGNMSWCSVPEDLRGSSRGCPHIGHQHKNETTIDMLQRIEKQQKSGEEKPQNPQEQARLAWEKKQDDYSQARDERKRNLEQHLQEITEDASIKQQNIVSDPNYKTGDEFSHSSWKNCEIYSPNEDDDYNSGKQEEVEELEAALNLYRDPEVLSEVFKGHSKVNNISEDLEKYWGMEPKSRDKAIALIAFMKDKKIQLSKVQLGDGWKYSDYVPELSKVKDFGEYIDGYDYWEETDYKVYPTPEDYMKLKVLGPVQMR